MFEQNLNRELDSQDLRYSRWVDAYDAAYNQTEAFLKLFSDEVDAEAVCAMASFLESNESSVSVALALGYHLKTMVKDYAHKIAQTAANEAESNGFQD
jgi:hypothetical protein